MLNFFNASEIFDTVLKRLGVMKQDYEGMVDEMKDELKELKELGKQGDVDQIEENLGFLFSTIEEYISGFRMTQDEISDSFNRFLRRKWKS